MINVIGSSIGVNREEFSYDLSLINGDFDDGNDGTYEGNEIIGWNIFSFAPPNGQLPIVVVSGGVGYLRLFEDPKQGIAGGMVNAAFFEGSKVYDVVVNGRNDGTDTETVQVDGWTGSRLFIGDTIDIDNSGIDKDYSVQIDASSSPDFRFILVMGVSVGNDVVINSITVSEV